MDKDYAKRFPVCPNCSGTDRFMEQLGQELKDRGLTPPETRVYMESKDGTLMNDKMVSRLPIGAIIPGFHIATDICMTCGTIYAVELVRTEGKFMGIQKSSGLQLN